MVILDEAKNTCGATCCIPKRVTFTVLLHTWEDFPKNTKFYDWEVPYAKKMDRTSAIRFFSQENLDQLFKENRCDMETYESMSSAISKMEEVRKRAEYLSDTYTKKNPSKKSVSWDRTDWSKPRPNVQKKDPYGFLGPYGTLNSDGSV